MLVSSAKRKKFNFVEEYWISFIYIRNKRGPRTEPCGTPQSMDCCSEITPLISVVCFRLLKYDEHKSDITPRKP